MVLSIFHTSIPNTTQTLTPLAVLHCSWVYIPMEQESLAALWLTQFLLHYFSNQLIVHKLQLNSARLHQPMLKKQTHLASIQNCFHSFP